MCISVCVCVCVCILLSVPHLELCLSTERREGKKLEVQEKKAAPSLFEYCRNIYQIIILTLSFPSISRHILCTIRILWY